MGLMTTVKPAAPAPLERVDHEGYAAAVRAANEEIAYRAMREYEEDLQDLRDQKDQAAHERRRQAQLAEQERVRKADEAKVIAEARAIAEAEFRSAWIAEFGTKPNYYEDVLDYLDRVDQAVGLAAWIAKARTDREAKAAKQREIDEAKRAAELALKLQEEETAQAEAFDEGSLDALDEYGDQKFVMSELIPDEMLTMLVGRVGSRKTFVGVSHSIAIALGADWVNRPTEQGPAVLVLLEGSGPDRKRRIDHIAAGFGVTRADLNHKLFLYPHSVKTEDPESFGRFVDFVKAINPRSIVIDNLTEICHGISQSGMSDRARMAPVIQPLRDLAQGNLADVPGCAVILIHHANAAGGVSGGDGIEQHADHVLYLEADSDRNDSTIEISRGKSRPGVEFAPFRIRFVDRDAKTVAAELVTPRDRAEQAPADPEARLAQLMCAALPKPSAALADEMKAAGFGSDKIQRMRDKLERDRVIEKDGKLWCLTRNNPSADGV